jgi:hypothetical protein
MDFDLTALRACFIPIMALERKYTSDGLSLVANKLVGDFRVVIMNTLVLALMRMVLFI